VLRECKTVRLRGHYNKDIEHYRPKEDSAAAAAADPLSRLIEWSMGAGALNADVIDQIDEDVSKLIDQITEAIVQMPLPDPDSVLDHLYGAAPDTPDRAIQEPKELTYQRAVNLALREELTARSDLIVYGEDVGFAGGIFGVSRGLQKEFGRERVFDTPISEAAILGSAVGAGLEGVLTVVEIMWADFVFVALDQIVNQAANVRYINRSRLNAPLTIRMQQGVTPGSCAQHSQSIEAFLSHIPGIKVGLPATAQDAYDMLRAAIADPDPTVIIEHRALYQVVGKVTAGGKVKRAEGARTHRYGSDLAILTWGAMLGEVLAAAEQLAREGIRATVVDLRWLRPLDEDAIAAAVTASGGRVLIVHEATVSGGFGAEVAARLAESHFGFLSGPIHRLGAPDVRMPSAPALQQAVLPTAERIAETARSMVPGSRDKAPLATTA
jgi:2-oxoisovalerate dehydrogenase E1 component